MSIAMRITVETDLDIAALAATLREPRSLYTRLAGGAEAFMRRVGPGIAHQNHRSADALGARRTGHLEAAYQAIEGDADEAEARLLIPRSSRLRAAFGPYTIRPSAGKKYLTIPVHPDAYGRRARELRDLFLMRSGPGGVPMLARRVEGTQESSLDRRTSQRRKRASRVTIAEVMYILATQADIPAQPGLIPVDQLTEEMRLTAGDWIDEQIERSLP